MKGFAIAAILAASATAFAQNGQSPQQQPQRQQNQPQNQPQTQQQNQQQSQQGQQTFTGCLSSAQNAYTLTVADPPVPGATATTTAYTLKPSGNIDLKSHVNQKVEVKGTAVSTDDAARVVEAGGDRTAGTSGAANNNTARNTGTVTPRVETTTKAQIIARTLNVSSVRQVASKCDPISQ